MMLYWTDDDTDPAGMSYGALCTLLAAPAVGLLLAAALVFGGLIR